MIKVIKVGAFVLLLVTCLMALSMPVAGVTQVVDDNNPNIPPELIVLKIETDTGIVPSYNITGQECYDLLSKAGRAMNFVSLRQEKVFPVYRKEDVETIYRVKYLNTNYPLILTILGGPYTEDDKGNCYQIVDNNGVTEVYKWKP